jgi:hypothetical protein
MLQIIHEPRINFGVSVLSGGHAILAGAFHASGKAIFGIFGKRCT